MRYLSPIYWYQLHVFASLFKLGANFAFAHAQRKFAKMVLYRKIFSSAALTNVESFMLVSGIA